MYIFHIIEKEAWTKLKNSKQAYHPESLDDVGFIHCANADQLLQVANNFYKEKDNLMILKIKTDLVKPKVLNEPPLEAPLSGVLYPHIYGELNLDSIEADFLFPLTEDGGFKLPEGLI